MSIRVGRIVYNSNGIVVETPSWNDYTSLKVTTKYSEGASLSPLFLTNKHNQIFENVYQFSKVYSKVPTISKTRSRHDHQIIWSHPEEEHIDQITSELNDNYWNWRKKGMQCKHAVRYPVGYYHRHKCLGIAWNEREDDPSIAFRMQSNQLLNYIEGRKKVYYPLYCEAARLQPAFHDLQNRLANGENLLILESDGPHQESLSYYQAKYNVDETFIEDNTMLATKFNLQIMLEDERHAFGHGYCLAALLQNINLLDK